MRQVNEKDPQMLIYMEASPALKGKARKFGRNYRKMALVELEQGFTGRPKMISDRAIGVARIVECRVLHVGSTDRSEGFRVRHELRAKATA